VSAHEYRRTRLIAAAFASSVIALGDGCLFGRSYGPSHTEELIPVDPRGVAAQPQKADGELPIEYCRAMCVGDSQIQRCYLATLGVVATPAEPTAPSIGSPFVHCYGYVPGGGDFIIR
jgi:hypothetical protein